MTNTMDYAPLLQFTNDHIPMRLVTTDGIASDSFRGKPITVVEPSLLSRMAQLAFTESAFYLRPAHLQQLAAIVKDSSASDNDRYVAYDLLKNANIAAGGILPMCQDTGTALVMGKKGQQVYSGDTDEAAISAGIAAAYAESNLRYSQMAPLSMFEEKNTGTNLPAQIELYASAGDSYELLCIAKGGGSANKSFLFQQTKAVLNPESLAHFIGEKMAGIGTAACPPYHLAVVIGGTSAEFTLKTVKLASTKYLDNLPTSGDGSGRAFRDLEWEKKIVAMSRQLGIGAQFGGRYFCHDVRVIRLPRHGASCPVGIGVSCSADRQVIARIGPQGAFIEQLEHDPAQYLPETDQHTISGASVSIDLDQGMEATLRQLDACSVATKLELNGTLIVARDIAHAKIKEQLVRGEPLPDYFTQYPIYYAGPAKTPPGYVSGSFGPTTAGRMDAYVDLLQQHGGSMVMLAKGNRSRQVADSCRKYGGFYLGCIGGSAARVAQESIKEVTQLAFPELGMEAVWKIRVERFPAFVIIDNKGNDFFAQYAIDVE